MARLLYLVAYDVCDPRRLARVCRYLKGYRVQGQKSVPEIWVTPAELDMICARLGELIDAAVDRVQVLALDARMKPRCFGQAATFENHYFCIV